MKFVIFYGDFTFKFYEEFKVIKEEIITVTTYEEVVSSSSSFIEWVGVYLEKYNYDESKLVEALDKLLYDIYNNGQTSAFEIIADEKVFCSVHKTNIYSYRFIKGHKNFLFDFSADTFICEKHIKQMSVLLSEKLDSCVSIVFTVFNDAVKKYFEPFEVEYVVVVSDDEQFVDGVDVEVHYNTKIDKYVFKYKTCSMIVDYSALVGISDYMSKDKCCKVFDNFINRAKVLLNDELKINNKVKVIKDISIFQKYINDFKTNKTLKKNSIINLKHFQKD